MNIDFLKQRIHTREKSGTKRILNFESFSVDFYSNDYLGFARSDALKKRVDELFSLVKPLQKLGATGSRLISGNSVFAEQLENKIAAFHRAESALLYTSGYAANCGLLSSLGSAHDVIFYDELSHASIYDGVKLSQARSFPFKHQNLEHLKQRLEYFKINKPTLQSQCFVVTESVFSMDGDLTPLTELTQMCEKYDALLIVDEAHATGVFGKFGEGRVIELGCEKNVGRRAGYPASKKHS